MSTNQLLAQAQLWLDQDPDPQTRAELAVLIESARAGSISTANSEAALADLADRFDGTLEFGTAGLRGALGAGSNRMNRVVVQRAAAGLVNYLKAHGGDTVVVGFDARHNSDAFAQDTAAVAVAGGLDAYLMPGLLPTPVLAFATRYLGADAGVMVTASHNPPADNGYKVYLGDGRQIVPPADVDIAAEIAAIGRVDELAKADKGWQVLDDEVVQAYLTRAASLLSPKSARDLRIAYTPMHGVGGQLFLDAFARAGFAEPFVVAEQAEPDPTFHTVAFPNPEEPGAMDLALALADDVQADLILANDPDADRCAAGSKIDGQWRMLRGDEIGSLLGEFIASRPNAQGTLACSIVSSTLLAKIAAAHGMNHEATLTGFKWISRARDLRFGYEEALGYCVDPEAVADKDGITASLLLAELAATLKAEGRGLGDALDDLARRYGLHTTSQLSVRVDDLSIIAAAMSRFRNSPPLTLGALAVEAIHDLALGYNGLPPTDGLIFALAHGARVIARPSGTEPKLKCYLEVVNDVSADADSKELASARHDAEDLLAAIEADLSAEIQAAASETDAAAGLPSKPEQT